MPGSEPPPRYHVRFFMEAGVQACLWPQDEPTKTKFGYTVELDRLGLPDALKAELTRLMVDFDHALAAHGPGGKVDTGPIVFGDKSDAPFQDRVVALVARLRDALGSDFLIETDFEV